MKKLLLFAFFYLSLCTNAQNFNAARHTLIDNTSNMVCINAKSYYAEYAGNDSLNIVGVTGNGQTLFRNRILQTFAGTSSLNMIRTLDKNIAVLSWIRTDCDVLSYSLTITKCDTSGNIVFQTSVPSFISMNGLPSAGFTQHPDSSFYVASTGSTLLHYSKTGVYTNSVNTGFTPVKSILALSSGSLLINGVIGTLLSNAVMSTAGSISTQQPANYNVRQFIEAPTGDLYALSTTGVVQKYTSGLLPASNSTTFLGTGVQLSTMARRNDSLFCAGQNTNTNQAFYAILNTNLGLIYQQQSSVEGLNPGGITVNNQNRVSVLSLGNTNDPRLLTFRSLNQMAVTGSITARYDIGVQTITVTPGPVYYFYPTHHSNMQIVAVIRNYGSDTVHDFYLNHKNSCGSSVNIKYQQAIAPGGTATVTMNNVKVSLGSMPVTTWPTTKEICVSTSVPDFEADVQNDNDIACANIEFDPVGIRENNLNHILPEVFPNPSGSVFQVRTSEEFMNLEVTNLTGQTIYSLRNAQMETTIDASHWAPGVYLLKAEGRSGTSTRKLVKN